MKIYNLKKKQWVELSQFMKEWKEGLKNITPLQQSYSTCFGQIVSFIGIIWGIIFSIRLGYYWMMVILIGGIIVLATQMLGNFQKIMILKQMDKIMKEADEVTISLDGEEREGMSESQIIQEEVKN